MVNRKPKTSGKISADTLLNDFLQTHNILLALNQPAISHTNDGQILISRPSIIAVYREDVPKGSAPIPESVKKNGVVKK